MFSSSSLLSSNKPVLIQPFTLSFSTEGRRFLKETGNQNLTLTVPVRSQIHVYFTQQKTPEYFQVTVALIWDERYSSEDLGGSSDTELSVAPSALFTLLNRSNHSYSFLSSNHLCHHEQNYWTQTSRRCQIREAHFVTTDGAFIMSGHSILPKLYYFFWVLKCFK